MKVPLRTVLQWLDEQNISLDAECWVLTNDTVLPVIAAIPDGGRGDIILRTAPVWSEPPPVPLTFDAIHDTILEHYSGAGELIWLNANSTITYRGSYVVNADNAVFFLFLPEKIELVETHIEKMEQRKKQAIDLTKEIEKNA